MTTLHEVPRHDWERDLEEELRALDRRDVPERVDKWAAAITAAGDSVARVVSLVFVLRAINQVLRKLVPVLVFAVVQAAGFVFVGIGIARLFP